MRFILGSKKIYRTYSMKSYDYVIRGRRVILLDSPVEKFKPKLYTSNASQVLTIFYRYEFVGLKDFVLPSHWLETARGSVLTGSDHYQSVFLLAEFPERDASDRFRRGNLVHHRRSRVHEHQPFGLTVRVGHRTRNNGHLQRYALHVHVNHTHGIPWQLHVPKRHALY